MTYFNVTRLKNQVMRPTFFGAKTVERFDRFCSAKIIVYTEIDKI